MRYRVTSSHVARIGFTSWRGVACYGVVPMVSHHAMSYQVISGQIRSDSVASNPIKQATPRHATPHHGMAWHGMAWHGMAWHGMARQDTTRHHTIQHDMTCYIMSRDMSLQKIVHTRKSRCDSQSSFTSRLSLSEPLSVVLCHHEGDCNKCK